MTRVESLTAGYRPTVEQWQKLDPENKLRLQSGDANSQACMCWLLYHVVEMTLPFLKTVTGSAPASIWVRTNSSQIIQNLKTLSNNIFHHIFDSIPPGFQPPFTRDACIAFTEAQIDLIKDILKLEGHLRELQENARQIYSSVHGSDDIAAFKLPVEFFHLNNAISQLYERLDLTGQPGAAVNVAQLPRQTPPASYGNSSAQTTPSPGLYRPTAGIPGQVPRYESSTQIPRSVNYVPQQKRSVSTDPAAVPIGPSDVRRVSDSGVQPRQGLPASAQPAAEADRRAAAKAEADRRAAAKAEADKKAASKAEADKKAAAKAEADKKAAAKAEADKKAAAKAEADRKAAAAQQAKKK